MMHDLGRMIIPGQCSQARDQPRCVIAKMHDTLRMIIQGARSRAHGPRCMIIRDFVARGVRRNAAGRDARCASQVATRDSVASPNAEIASRERRARSSPRDAWIYGASGGRSARVRGHAWVVANYNCELSLAPLGFTSKQQPTRPPILPIRRKS